MWEFPDHQEEVQGSGLRKGRVGGIGSEQGINNVMEMRIQVIKNDKTGYVNWQVKWNWSQ